MRTIVCKVRADEEGLYYLVISGVGAGQAMEIKAMLNGEIITIDNSLTFVSDDHLGTPWEPYIINFQKAEGIEDLTTNGQEPTAIKIIEDNHLDIIRNGKKYDATGKELK